jgi:gluconolactonase
MTAMLTVLSVLAQSPPALVEGNLEIVAEGFQFTEGPVWLPGTGLLFSDIPANTIYEAPKKVFRKPSGKSNGLVLDEKGRLVACEHGNRRVTRTLEDGTVEVIADAYESKKLNSPNDAVVRSDGTVFFTDPPYGLEGREAELPFSGVYAVLPSGKMMLLADDFDRPNGIALSPGERTLYVADTAGNVIRAFDLNKDAEASNRRTFCELSHPDGMAVDAHGRVWSTSSEGIQVFNPDGKLVHTIETEENPTNCAFGGEDGQTLFITARPVVYKTACTVPGLAWKD